MLTYEAIRNAMLEEKKSTKLTELPENFFQEALVYLESKEKMKENKEDAWELESAKRLLQDILEIRERKIVNLALYHVRSGIVPGNLMPEEKEFFDAVVKSIREFQERKKEILFGKKKKTRIVALLEDTPEFVGVDMKTYGPFKRGDIATLPEENAKLLLEKGLAREIKP